MRMCFSNHYNTTETHVLFTATDEIDCCELQITETIIEAIEMGMRDVVSTGLSSPKETILPMVLSPPKKDGSHQVKILNELLRRFLIGEKSRGQNDMVVQVSAQLLKEFATAMQDVAKVGVVPKEDPHIKDDPHKNDSDIMYILPTAGKGNKPPKTLFTAYSYYNSHDYNTYARGG